MPTKYIRRTARPGSDVYEIPVQLNKVLGCIDYQVEDLAAGADISARPIVLFPVAGEIVAVQVIHQGASAGIDAGNTAVLTLRNITTSTDIATSTLSTNVPANHVTTLTIAAPTIAAGDLIGITVTQGTNANLAAVAFAIWYRTHDQLGERNTVISS